MVLQTSHYELLGLEANCELSEIKQAYREKLLSSHPDKMQFREDSPRIGDGASIEKIKLAYRVLSDPESRARYDSQLAESYKKHGFHNTGEGLDSFSLDDFEYSTGTEQFCMDCPRCQSKGGFELTEDMLEENAIDNPSGGYLIVVQCSACSLWLQVTFDVVED
ncbi:LAFA_0G02960g1_1 [Lachancea sp. 'fantastica']|nr:LAFA_0G02960g1_1 [Lachancea sp. 'fantastica']